MTAKISIIMLVYDAVPLKYFKQALHSLSLQGLGDMMKTIIVQNGETEKFYDTIHSYEDKCNITDVIINPKNVGMPKAQNKALDKIDTPYIGFQDPDDWSKHDRLWKQYNFLEKNKTYGAIGSNLVLIDENGKVLECWRFPEKADNLWGRRPDNLVGGASALCRTNAIKDCGGFDEHYLYCCDFRLFVEIWHKGYNTGNLQEYLYYYRQWPGQISRQNKDKQIIEHQKILNIAHKYRGE